MMEERALGGLAPAVTSFQAPRSISRAPKYSKRQGHVTINLKVRANVPAGLGGNRFLEAPTRYRPPLKLLTPSGMNALSCVSIAWRWAHSY